MIILIDCVHGSAQINELMHKTGVLEPFKQIADYKCIEIEGDDPIENKIVPSIKEALEKAGELVVFVAVREMDGKVPDLEKYIMPGVSIISNGKKFGPFKDFLEHMGYKVETNQYDQVINATL